MLEWILGIALLLLFLNLLFFYMKLVDIKEEREDGMGPAAIAVSHYHTLRVVRSSLFYTIVVLVCVVILLK